MAHRRAAVLVPLSVFIVCLAATLAPAQGFDLADAVGMGNGTLPGTGNPFTFPTNSGLSFLTAPNHTYVNGIFVPRSTGLTTIDATGTTFDFSPFISTNSTVGGPANGALSIADPSNVGGNPNYTGDPANHSIMAAHANVGITFDLNAIRNAVPTFTQLTANVGSSNFGAISYFVLVDGVLQASGSGLTNASFNAINVGIPFTASYLTMVVGDSNAGTINSAHGYWGDPFLTSGSVTPTYPGNGSDVGTQVSINGGISPQLSGVHFVAPGNLVTLTYRSPNGTLTGNRFVALAQVVPTGLTIFPTCIPGDPIPSLFLVFTAQVVVLADGFVNPSSLFSPVLPHAQSFVVPPSVAGSGLSAIITLIAHDPGYNLVSLGTANTRELVF